MNGNYSIGETVFGNWTLNRLIGEGSFGLVYEAVREDFGRTYKAAVKVITIPQSQSEISSVMADGMNEESVTAYFRSFVEALVDEFSLMSQLKGNSNVVSYEDHTVIPHTRQIGWDILIRMELLTPMLRFLKEHALTRRDICRLGIDMCKALELCKKYNIIHRDIKPENIFVSEIGDFKLGDFGIARTVEKTSSGLSKKGTYTYMAPEVYKGNQYGANVDIYSLGIVLYRFLNGNRTPFLPDYPAPITHSDRETALVKRISGEQIPTPKYADGDFTSIVLKACAYDPGERYTNPAHMRQDLESVMPILTEIAIIQPQSDIAPNPSVENISTAEKPAAPQQSQHIQNDQTSETYPVIPPVPVVVQNRSEPEAHDGRISGVFTAASPQSPVRQPVSVQQPAPAEKKPPEYDQTASVFTVPQTKAEKQKKKFPLLAVIIPVVAVIAVAIIILLPGRAIRDSMDPSSISNNNVNQTTESGKSTQPDGNQNSGPNNSHDNSSGAGMQSPEPGENPGAIETFPVVSGVSDELTFNSLVWGWYEIENPDDLSDFLEFMKYDIVTNDDFYPDDEMSALPYSITAGPKQFLLSQYYEAIPELDWMECFWYRKGRGKVHSIAPYTIEGNTIYLVTDFNYDEASDTININDGIEIRFHFDGINLVLTRNGAQATLIPYEFSKESKRLSVTGYVTDITNAYQNMESISFWQNKDGSGSSGRYIDFLDGSKAIDPEIQFNDDGTMSVNWTEKWNKWSQRENDPGSFSSRYIWSGNDGLIFIDNGKYYIYQTDWLDYRDARLADSLGVAPDSLSDSKAEALINVQKRVLSDLQEAFGNAGISADIDEMTGRITMDTNILFAVNDSALSAAGKAYLDGFLDVYAAVVLSETFIGSIAEIIVEGHTDTDGSYEHNMTLSEQRAAAVAEYCLFRQPELAKIMATRGFSYDYPIYDANGVENKAASRRVVFRFILSAG